MANLRWHDVSIPLHPGMTVWPGDPPFEIAPLNRIGQGANCNTSRLALATHTGTHIDAPWHFEEGGLGVDAIDPAVFFGEARLIDVRHVDVVRADDLGADPLPPRVLIKTRNAQYPPDAPFRTDYVALAADAAARLVDAGVRLVGVDYLSVAPYKQPGQDTHHRLLRANVLVVEGLRLQGFPAGVYPFIVLPLLLVGADGAPCRAFLGREDAAA
jgi:arylformamidase